MAEKVALSYAVFGPLSTGADVRLLATTKGLKLTREASDELSRFYFAGWRAARQQPGPYWAFFPLDDEHWGLAQSQLVGDGAFGALFVVWFALLDRSALERVGWRTHRLWRTAFPQPLLLPGPETAVTIAAAPLSEAPATGVRASEVQLDSLASAIERAKTGRNSSRYALPETVAATPADGLFAIWERLGRWADKLSYCTWGGIVEAGFSPREGRFDVLVDFPGADRAQGVEELLAIPPTSKWLLEREAATGIAAPKAPADDHTAKEIASVWFDLHKRRLIDQRDFTLFLELANQTPDRAFALPELLRLTVEAVSRDQATLAVNRFVRETLPTLVGDSLQSVTPPRRIVTMSVTRHKLTMGLEAETIEELASELLGDDRSDVFVKQLSESLMPLDTALGVPEQAASEAILRHLPAGEEQDRLRNRLIGRLWSPDREEDDRVADRLDGAGDLRQAVAIFMEIREHVPAGLRASFSDVYSGHLANRALAPPPADASYAALCRRMDAMFQVGAACGITLAGSRLGSEASA